MSYPHTPHRHATHAEQSSVAVAEEEKPTAFYKAYTTALLQRQERTQYPDFVQVIKRRESKSLDIGTLGHRRVRRLDGIDHAHSDQQGHDGPYDGDAHVLR
jgi:hypothetical protein